jgi:hypothetical protein
MSTIAIINAQKAIEFEAKFQSEYKAENAASQSAQMPPNSSTATNAKRSTGSGKMYSVESIEGYQSASSLNSYAALSAQQKATASTSEDVSIKGAIAVPVATDFSESKKSLNEVAATKGQLASVPDIDVCSFLSKIPPIKIDLNPDLGGGNELSDLIGEINGITLKGMQVVSDAIVGIVGGIGAVIGDTAAAIDAAIPDIKCGSPPPTVMVDLPIPTASAITTPSAPSAPVQEVPDVEYGTDPQITVESPDVTVKSIDDVLDSGEF